MYDKWREFYLQQLAAGEIPTETRKYDLEQMWLSTQLNSKVIRVTEGQSVQAAIDAAVDAGAGLENPWIVEVDPGVVVTYTPTPGVEVVPSGNVSPHPVGPLVGAVERNASYYPVACNLPMVAIVMDDGDGACMDVPDGSPFGANITPFQYCVLDGIPVSHAIVSSWVS